MPVFAQHMPCGAVLSMVFQSEKEGSMLELVQAVSGLWWWHVLWSSSNAGNSARCAIYFNLTGKKMPAGTCAASIWKMQRSWHMVDYVCMYIYIYKNVGFGTMISASARPKESCVLVCLLMNGQVQSLQSLWITWRSQNAQSSETHVVLFSCFFG